MSSYPSPKPHRIMTSTDRARTEPALSTGGFMKSVLRQHELDDVDEGMGMLLQPVDPPLDPPLDQPQKKITQEEQDALDDKARKRAMRNLVNSWQERLQLISVITTFFASTEAAMLVNTKPTSSTDFENGALKAANASLLGALIVHVYAAILSFLGAFLLIRYKLKEATREEMIAEGKMVNSPLSGSLNRDATIDLGPPVQQTLTNIDGQSTMHKSVNNNTPKTTPKWTPGPIKRNSFPIEPPIFKRNPHIEQVGPMGNVSSHLLSRTHSLCVFLASVGFVLAIVGILCYAWASQPREVSIFASTCFGGVLLAIALSLLRKD